MRTLTFFFTSVDQKKWWITKKNVYPNEQKTHKHGTAKKTPTNRETVEKIKGNGLMRTFRKVHGSSLLRVGWHKEIDRCGEKPKIVAWSNLLKVRGRDSLGYRVKIQTQEKLKKKTLRIIISWLLQFFLKNRKHFTIVHLKKQIQEFKIFFLSFYFRWANKIVD